VGNVRWSAAVVLGVVLLPAGLFAQDGKPAHARLNLGITSQTFGEEAELELRIALPEGVQAGKLQAEVLLPADTLTFVRAFAPTSSMDDLRIETTAKPASDAGDAPGRQVVAIAIRSTERPLPPDLVATLVLKVGEKVKSGIVPVGLRNGRLWAYPDVSREITPVDTYEGRVSVQAPEVFACFFYMH
jgi:hypothetical protein